MTHKYDTTQNRLIASVTIFGIGAISEMFTYRVTKKTAAELREPFDPMNTLKACSTGLGWALLAIYVIN